MDWGAPAARLSAAKSGEATPDFAALYPGNSFANAPARDCRAYSPASARFVRVGQALPTHR